MRLHSLVYGALLGGAVVGIAHNHRAFITVVSNIFSNTIVKSSLIGLAGGVAVTAILQLRARQSPQTRIRTQAGMGADVVEQLVLLFGPPIIGALSGALIGGFSSLSRHVTIIIK